LFCISGGETLNKPEHAIMTNVAVVYHSGYGHTAIVAEHVAKGAASVPGVTARLYRADELLSPDAGPWTELAAADAIIFGAPTYMGSASAPMKQFMDASSKVWFTQGWKNKIAAGFTNSASWSGDKLSTLSQFAVFAAQQGMIWTGTGLMPGNNSSAGSPEDINRVGSFLGLMTQANADQGPDVAPPKSDRRTAELFGHRVAEIAVRWKSGATATVRAA
jgi:multimeric flavodoxin WrbA